MISFKEYAKETLTEARSDICALCPQADEEYLCEILASFSSLDDEDTEIALSFSSGCLLVRIFDMGRYIFVYPISICEPSDELCAVDDVRAYAVKEEIPLCFSDVPAECLGDVASHFRHISADAEDRDCTSYRVCAISEAALIKTVPELEYGAITLSLISERDAKEYAGLCRDGEVNKYWGYDYRSDVSEDVSECYFVSEAISEYRRGVSVTLGVHLQGEFIGEAVLHAFDLLGGCELAFRLLPEFWGRGFGAEILLGTIELARKLGICRVYARVINENVRSVALLSKYMELCEDGKEQKKYKTEI